MSELSINPADIQNLTHAVRFAAKSGAFEMEQVSQLFPSVSRLEEWVNAIKEAQDQAARETEEAEVVEPTAPKKGKNK